MSDSVAKILRFVGETYGEKARTVFSKLFELSREVTDHDLARELNLHEAEVRKILYQLSEEGLVSARRVRDRETNYYVYYWRANIRDLPRVILRRKKLILQVLRKRLEYEEKNTFICPRCGRRYSLDDALLNEFVCPVCGTALENNNDTGSIEKIREIISRIEREVAEEERRVLSRSI